MKKLVILIAVTALAGCSGMMGQRSSSGGMSSMSDAGASGGYFSSPYGPDGYDMQSGRPLPAGF